MDNQTVAKLGLDRQEFICSATNVSERLAISSVCTDYANMMTSISTITYTNCAQWQYGLTLDTFPNADLYIQKKAM